MERRLFDRQEKTAYQLLKTLVVEMEKKFYSDNFEQFLRETTDEFRMYPSRKVWHSIYNDLHPAKRWPSLAVLLLLVSSIMYVGVTNPDAADKQSAAYQVLPAEIAQNGASARLDPANQLKIASVNPGVINQQIINNSNILTPLAINPVEFQSSKQQYLADNGLSYLLSSESFSGNEIATIAKFPVTLTGEVGLDNELSAIAGLTGDAEEKTKSDLLDNSLSKEDEEWIEAFAFHNKPKAGLKSRLSYQVYATPSVGYRTLSKNAEIAPESNTASLVANPVVEDESILSHSSALNLETGANVLFSLSRNMRLKAGIQLNYTNYHVNAYELSHPTITNLLMNEISSGQPMLVSRMTTLSNVSGNPVRNLNNNTYQFSVPVGADFRLAGNGTISWFAGATFQPTFITGGNTYLVSSDKKNYIEDPALLRKFNMNGGIETFISYKTKHGIILNAGPQLRYQFLSSYEDTYTYDEKLYNIGVKLGITTNF